MAEYRSELAKDDESDEDPLSTEQMEELLDEYWDEEGKHIVAFWRRAVRTLPCPACMVPAGSPCIGVRTLHQAVPTA